ncbi:GTP-binding protein [Halobacteriales archaeon QS_5_70_15]|nr:MAG: GTP-binding protein [Halobacteriales archaeon QS_5_70_15]
MSSDRAALDRAIERGEEEGGSVEFKERLARDVHLADGRLESLAAQLRHRVLSGDGEATYVVGVTDDGGIAGIAPEAFTETMDVLSLLAEEAGAHIDDVQTWGVRRGASEAPQANGEAGSEPGDEGADRGVVGVATIREGAVLDTDDEHIVVGTAGHVDHGKSTLVGSLVTGHADDGQGGTRSFLDVQPHEVERGLSADLSYGVYGFEADGTPVTFVDTVGHEPWLRTTIRGLVGQKLDYGLLVVAADDGPTKTTREHLGILLATELPTIVAVTKCDVVDEERVADVEREVERLLRGADRTPLSVARHGVESAIEEIDRTVVPVVRTSAVTMAGLPTLDRLFERLPKTGGDDGEWPMSDGSFREVEVRSIEMHYHRVDEASAGRIVGIALKGVREPDVRRGMTLLPRDADPRAVREFEAEVMVLNHPTRIGDGYEPVVHLETVSEAAAFSPEDGQLLPGDTGRSRVRFKFHPYLVEEGQRFVFREGRSKGVGTVTDIHPG